MSKKRKISIGDSIVKSGNVLILDEVFTADGVRWVKANRTRKKYTVKFQGKTHVFYDSENTYLTELEWLVLKKT